MEPEPGPFIFEHTKPCVRCKHDVTARLVRNVTQSGVSQVYWFCMAGRHGIDNPIKFISHEKITQVNIEIDKLPVLNDYRGEMVCSVWGCDKPAEYHHIAPKHIFGDEAEHWPGTPFCKYHHDIWHALVTPDMPGANKKAGDEWIQAHTK